MGTHATITAKTSDGKFKSIHLGYDGYPEHAGQVLVKHYTDQAKIDALMIGNLSSIDELCDKPDGHTYDTPAPNRCVYYGRDRGEEGEEAAVGDTAEEAIDNNMYGEETYSYIWDGKNWTMGGMVLTAAA